MRLFALLAVCVTVCLSVRPPHVCFMTKSNNALRIFWYHTKGQSLQFSNTNTGWWATPPSVWNLRSNWSTPSKNADFDRFPLITSQLLEITKKVQLWQIGSRPRAFERAIDGVRTLPLSPLKDGPKAIFCFLIQFNFDRINSATKLLQMDILFPTKRTEMVVTNIRPSQYTKMLLRPGLRPWLNWGSSQRFPDLLVGCHLLAEMETGG